MSYRKHQKAHGDTYMGNYETHSSHYLSEKELGHFKVSRSAGNYEGNYRNCNAFTNQSEHNRIDNLLMETHRTRGTSIGGFSYSSGGDDYYVSRQAMVNRVTHKIEVAKASGAIENERLANYLYQSAQRLNMDMRIFNGCDF